MRSNQLSYATNHYQADAIIAKKLISWHTVQVRPKLRLRHLCLLIVVLSSLIYLPFIKSPFIWDDEQFIVKNEYVTRFNLLKLFTTNTTAGAGLTDNYYRPLTSVSLAFDYQFWQTNTIGFHLTNWMLHTGAALMVLLFLLRIGVKRNWSALIALVFAIHPIATESVAYINSRGDSLYTLLLLSSLYCFTYVIKKETLKVRFFDQTTHIKVGWLALCSLVLFSASVLSKEIALAGAGLFFLVFVQQLLTEPRAVKHTSASLFKTQNLSLITLTGTALLSATYLALRLTALNFAHTFSTASGSAIYDSSLVVRLLTFTQALLEYIPILLLPIQSHMEHSLPIITSPFSPAPVIMVSLLLILLALGFLEKRTTKQVWIWFGLGWYVLLLLPVSGIIPVNGLLYEHWLYLPQIGFWLMLYGCVTLIGAVIDLKRAKSFLLLLFALIATALILLSIRQNYRWADPIRFYTYTLQFAQSARLLNNLAMSVSETGNLNEAENLYQKAIMLDDSYPQTHHNLGNVYLAKEDLAAAQREFETAISMSPGFLFSYQPLYSIYTQTNQATAAAQLEATYNAQLGN